MKKLLLLMIMVLFSVGVFATEYWISPSGTDTLEDNGGQSKGNPWQHFSYALDHMSADDSLIVMDGTYSNAGTVLLMQNKTGITITAEHERIPLLENTQQPPHNSNPVIMVQQCSNINIEGLTCRNTRTTDTTAAVIKIENCNDISLRRMLASEPNEGISDEVPVYFIMKCQRVLVEECEAYDFKTVGFGLYYSVDGTPESDRSDGCTIRRCYANSSPYNGYYGYVTRHSSNATIENCIGENLQKTFAIRAGYPPIPDPPAEDVLPAPPYVKKNYILGSIALDSKFGIWAAGRYEFCTLWNPPEDTLIKDCLLIGKNQQDGGVGISLRSVESADVENCTITKFQTGFIGDTTAWGCYPADTLGSFNCWEGSSFPTRCDKTNHLDLCDCYNYTPPATAPRAGCNGSTVTGDAYPCNSTVKNTLSFDNLGYQFNSAAYNATNYSIVFDHCNSGGASYNFIWTPYTCTLCSQCDNPNHTGEYFTCPKDIKNGSGIAKYCLQQNYPGTDCSCDPNDKSGMGMSHNQTLLWVPPCNKMFDFKANDEDTPVTVGANVCRKYENGTQTLEPVFEFPMDDPKSSLKPAIAFPSGAVVPAGINDPAAGNVAANVLHRLNAEGYDKMPDVRFYDSFDSDHNCTDWTLCEGDEHWSWDETNEEFDDSNATTTINWNEPDTAITGDVSFFQADVTPTNLLYGYNEIGMRAFYLSDANGESYIQLSILQGTGDCAHLLYFKKVEAGTITEQEELVHAICLNKTYRLRVKREYILNEEIKPPTYEWHLRVYLNREMIHDTPQGNMSVGTGMKIGVAKAAATFDEVLIGR